MQFVFLVREDFVTSDTWSVFLSANAGIACASLWKSFFLKSYHMSSIGFHSLTRNKMGGEVPCPNQERGYPTPHSKPRGGDPLPPCRTKDRVPPPFGCMPRPTASCGVTTESPFSHAKGKGGYTHPLSKKRGGDTCPAYPLSETREGSPSPQSYEKSSPSAA